MSEWTDFDLPEGGYVKVDVEDISAVYAVAGHPAESTIVLACGEAFRVEHPIAEAMRGLDA